jgi:rSAM/selenodomain-associated transferase 1
MAWSLPDGAVLGIFGGRPDPGRCNTRLAGEFGPETAAAIEEAMLFDLLDTWSGDRVLAPGGRRVLAYAPADAGPWFDARVPEAFALQPQAEGNPGARRHAFFAGEFDDGATRVVMIGSDTPALDPSVVVSALLCLDGRDVVLGPSTDGGYYLVGCRGEVAPIFEGVAWGTPNVLAETIDRLNATGLSLAVLPPAYRVDTPTGWRTLAGHIRALRRAGVRPDLPRVEALMERTVPRGSD